MARRSAHRDAVIRVIADASGPLSADEVRELLKDTGIGQATVYRVLKAAYERGELVAVDLPNAPTRYESADLPHHHHFHCTACGRVYDIQGCPGNMKKMLPKGFTLEQHEVLLYGVCVTCHADAA